MREGRHSQPAGKQPLYWHFPEPHHLEMEFQAACAPATIHSEAYPSNPTGLLWDEAEPTP